MKETSLNEWDFCGCKESHSGPAPLPDQVRCGCGHHVFPLPETSSEAIIHWLGQHWLLACAMDEAVELLDKLHHNAIKARRLLAVTDDADDEVEEK